jgi:hypothetical protein
VGQDAAQRERADADHPKAERRCVNGHTQCDLMLARTTRSRVV